MLAYNKRANYKNKQNKQNKYDYGKDRDSIYEAKTYPKKQKNRNEIFDIPLFDYELDKARQRQKREIDQKKKKNRKYAQYGDY